MFFNLISEAYAMGPSQPAGAESGGMGNMLIQLAPLAIIFAIFYFLMIRPQQKKQKAVKAMLDALKKGDKVVTAGGIYGVVDSVEPTTVTVKIADNVKVKVNRNSIATIRTEEEKGK